MFISGFSFIMYPCHVVVTSNSGTASGLNNVNTCMQADSGCVATFLNTDDEHYKKFKSFRTLKKKKRNEPFAH